MMELLCKMLKTYFVECAALPHTYADTYPWDDDEETDAHDPARSHARDPARALHDENVKSHINKLALAMGVHGQNEPEISESLLGKIARAARVISHKRGYSVMETGVRRRKPRTRKQMMRGVAAKKFAAKKKSLAKTAAKTATTVVKAMHKRSVSPSPPPLPETTATGFKRTEEGWERMSDQEEEEGQTAAESMPPPPSPPPAPASSIKLAETRPNPPGLENFFKIKTTPHPPGYNPLSRDMPTL